MKKNEMRLRLAGCMEACEFLQQKNERLREGLAARDKEITHLRKVQKDLLNDREGLQERLSEIGSDSVGVLELPLEMRLSVEEMKVYENGVGDLKMDELMFPEYQIGVTNVCTMSPECREFILKVIDEALYVAQSR